MVRRPPDFEVFVHQSPVPAGAEAGKVRGFPAVQQRTPPLNWACTPLE